MKFSVSINMYKIMEEINAWKGFDMHDIVRRLCTAINPTQVISQPNELNFV